MKECLSPRDAVYHPFSDKLLFEEKVFTGVAGTNTIRLLPPLCLSMDEAKEFIVRFRKVLNA